jgi:hypothetical protein
MVPLTGVIEQSGLVFNHSTESSTTESVTPLNTQDLNLGSLKVVEKCLLSRRASQLLALLLMFDHYRLLNGHHIVLVETTV